MKYLPIRDQHCYLFADWERVEDPGGVIDEASLQHLVHLVQDGEPHIVHTQEALTDQLLDPAWGAHSDLTNQRLVFRSRDQSGPIRSLPYLTRPRPDLVLGEAEAPNEGLDLDTLHLLTNLLGHSHTLQ